MVNLIKLTKLERKVLGALTQSKEDRYDRYPKQGNDEYGLSQILFPGSHDHYTGNGYYLEPGQRSITYPVRSSLSRVLNSLYRKGLVKKCSPAYRYTWHKKDNEGSGGYFGKEYSLEMRVKEAGQSTKLESFGQFRKLPRRVRYWWMLSGKGRELLDQLE